jgi:hypothetical protein
METYRKSILEYDDVFHAVSWAAEQNLEKGIGIGERRGIEIGKKQGVEIGEKRGIEIGEKRGIGIGEKRGEKQMQIKLVKNWYNSNKSISQIAELLDLTEKQVSDMLIN